MKTRKAEFAGSWYPSAGKECEQEILTFIKSGKTPVLKGSPTGGIVPHAGWYFSGAIACNVIRCLKNEAAPDLIIVFGMHLHPKSPPHIMAEGQWETPFGNIEVHEELAEELMELFEFNVETPDNFVQDNTIELQLPFIKYFFPDARILTLGLPPAEHSLKIAVKCAQIAEKKGLDTKVIGSTDLTHYGSNYGFAPKGYGKAGLDWVKNENDRGFIDTVLSLDPEKIISVGCKNHSACCSGAAACAVAAVKQLGGANKSELIEYSTSYDKHPSDSFVGYAGIIF
ncbi:AmmeMemoRadiSam system protein B [Desulfobacterales bacterium HSG16]|nr:AmmeMemoRadiSam system protein B [Desulfobacterales bacterium HSG16]